MVDTAINNTAVTISNTPGTAGDFVIVGPITRSDGLPVRDFTAAHNGMSFAVTAHDAAGDEQRTGCVYTHATRTLTRGTREDSSTGADINLTSAAVVTVTMSAGLGNALEVAMQSIIPGGRLTLESGVPISTTDQIAKTTIYYTPYVHNAVPLWDGNTWHPTTFTETSLALGTLTSGKCYDVFGYLSAGALALEMLVWTSDTARATAVTLQDGRYCKSGDKTRLLLGTFYTTSTTTTEDSLPNRYLANLYNQVERSLLSCPAYASGNSVTSYTHNSTSWAPANGGTGAAVSYLLPIVAKVNISIQAVGDPGGVSSIGAGVGDDSMSGPGLELLGVTSTRLSAATTARFTKQPGRHYASLLLRVSGGTATMYADNTRNGAADDPMLTHISGEVSI